MIKIHIKMYLKYIFISRYENKILGLKQIKDME